MGLQKKNVLFSGYTQKILWVFKTKRLSQELQKHCALKKTQILTFNLKQCFTGKLSVQNWVSFKRLSLTLSKASFSRGVQVEESNLMEPVGSFLRRRSSTRSAAENTTAPWNRPESQAQVPSRSIYLYSWIQDGRQAVWPERGRVKQLRAIPRTLMLPFWKQINKWRQIAK